MENLSLVDKNRVKELFVKGDLRTQLDVMEVTKAIFKELMETMVESELDNHLGYAKYNYSNKKTENSRNGSTPKTIRTGDLGEVTLEVPRDRNGTFESLALPKHERNFTGLDEKVISMYAKGMTTRDIESHLRDIYGVDMSHEAISKMIDKIMPVVKEWQSRPLKPIYTFMFLDAIHYNVRSEGTIVKKAAYVAVGIGIDGRKEVIGIYVGENETSKYWMTILNEMKNRGIKDILIIATDGLSGFKEALSAVFPKAEIQRCIVHQIRNTIKYLSYKDVKVFLSELKEVYGAAKEEFAMSNLLKMKEKWGKKYPTAIKIWEDNWDVLSTFYKYPAEIRKIMYTTNIIESLNRQYRKVTKTKSIFPNDDSLLKSLYLSTVDIEKKWTGKIRDWSYVIGQLEIFFGDRITNYLY